MKREEKSAEQVEVEKQRGVEKAHTYGLPTTKVETASYSAEKARIKSDEKARGKKD